jgi:hypothetical protein
VYRLCFKNDGIYYVAKQNMLTGLITYHQSFGSSLATSTNILIKTTITAS